MVGWQINCYIFFSCCSHFNIHMLIVVFFVHRHNFRKKRQEREVLQQNVEPFTAPLVASELLRVRSKLPAPLKHGHLSFEFSIHEDASGQARQHVRGQRLPTTAPAATPGLLLAPAAASTSTAAPAAAHSHVPTSAAAPAAAPAPFAAPAIAAAPIPAPHDQRVPRTTAWRRRKTAETAGSQGVTPQKDKPRNSNGQKCGQPKTKELDHSQFLGVHFCAKASGKTVAQWLEEVKKGQTK